MIALTRLNATDAVGVAVYRGARGFAGVAMKRIAGGLFGIGCAVALVACGSERGISLAGPVAPTAAPSTASPAAPTAPSLVGTWVPVTSMSTASATVSFSVCSNIQLQLTRQTATEVSGTLSMQCPDGLLVSGTISGQLGGATIPVVWNGVAAQSGFPSCPFSMTGTATPLAVDTLRITYEGNSCRGPVQGSDTFRLSSTLVPAPGPAPAPVPNPVSPFHVGPGPLSEERAEQVVRNTGREFPHLTRVFPTDAEALDAASELLRRTIWHLQLAGYQAARQRNPSGLISQDKMTIFVNGSWRAYDIFSLGFAGRATTVQFLPIGGANPVPDPGLAD